ncbi:MAG: hypothetical protein WHW07_08235 [Bacteroidales bacterium]|jgi:hypothetical protein|nr:hypothetical protein [Flavobacterium piscis]HOK38413.1 hypothetical protein [Bacteroidales bacterium]HOL97694.1 hypothetical protein [Bacteroidales bacterium]HOM37421.1 hypothetical protein [Bacteroidales bacterium]HPD24926.1 hypothetical protein [Bacteroidales bacterium]
MEYNVISILVREPVKVGSKLQDVLSLYGCVIRTRLGLNREEIAGGIILMELNGDQNQINLLISELNEIEGIEFKQIII